MTLNIRIFVNFVTSILDYFWTTGKATQCNLQPHFDVELTKEDDFYLIYVTNCDCSDGNFEEFFDSSYTELNSLIEFDNYFKTITAFVRVTNDEEWAYDLLYPGNRACQISTRRLDTNESRRFEHLKNYQSFMLKCTLLSKDIRIFKEYLLRTIMTLVDQRDADRRKSSFNAKYTFHCGQQLIYQSHDESTKAMANCKRMSFAITKILERSRKDEFRKRCLALLDVCRSCETGNAVMSKLLPLVPAGHQGKKRDNNFARILNNNQAKKTDKIYQGKKRDDKLSTFLNNNQAKKINKIDQVKTRNNEVGLDSNNNQATNDKENNQSNSVISPIIMSSRGRRIKRTKHYDELYKK